MVLQPMGMQAICVNRYVNTCAHMPVFKVPCSDRDSLIVSYDPARGEQRGPRRKGVDYKSQGLGIVLIVNYAFRYVR